MQGMQSMYFHVSIMCQQDLTVGFFYTWSACPGLARCLTMIFRQAFGDRNDSFTVPLGRRNTVYSTTRMERYSFSVLSGRRQKRKDNVSKIRCIRQFASKILQLSCFAAGCRGFKDISEVDLPQAILFVWARCSARFLTRVLGREKP